MRKATVGVGALQDVLAVPAPAGGRVFLHVPTGTYLALDESASLIVELLAASHSEAQASAQLAAKADISLSRAEADVSSVVGALARLRKGGGRAARRPSLVGAVHELASWWRLPDGRRWAVLRIALVLTITEIGLRVVDIRRLSHALGAPLSPSDEPPAPPVDQSAVLSPDEVRSFWAIEWIGRRWLFPVTCLRSALVMGVVLRRRRPVLRLGIMADGVTAHAWVEAQGVSYGAGEVSGVFRSVL